MSKFIEKPISSGQQTADSEDKIRHFVNFGSNWMCVRFPQKAQPRCFGFGSYIITGKIFTRELPFRCRDTRKHNLYYI